MAKKKTARKRAKRRSKRGPGAPTKFTVETKKKILEGIEEGMSITAACPLAGISPETMYGWKRKAEIDKRPEFIRFFGKIREIEAILQKQILEDWKSHMSTSPSACRDFLERRFKADWAPEKKVTLDGNVAQDITTREEPPIDMSNLNDDEFNLFRALLAKAKKGKKS